MNQKNRKGLQNKIKRYLFTETFQIHVFLAQTFLDGNYLCNIKPYPLRIIIIRHRRLHQRKKLFESGHW